VVSKDLVTGAGATAAADSTVSVNYHGVTWSDGCVFDSSFARGQAVDFPLDQLITCWQDGIPGMAEGGRRLLVCPPDTAYGPAGSGHPLAGQTLVFVIDLEKVGA
jgi:peptidylprolyl isomerase